MVFYLLLLLFGAPNTQDAATVVDFDSSKSTGLTSGLIADGWLTLFDGETTFGWRGVEQSNWKAGGGVLASNQNAIHTNVGLLRTAAQFDNFQLKFNFAISHDASSSLFLRTSPMPSDRQRDCFEVVLASGSESSPTGSISSHKINAKVVAIESGESSWNEMEVYADGPTIRIIINGTKVLDFHADKHQHLNASFVKKGFIGLLAEEGTTKIRNLIVQPMLHQQMLNDQLDKWRQNESRESEFAVGESVLKMKNGPGQLETIETFGDFIFCSHIRTNAVGLNSGIFFRCIPGQFMNGYESQIQNQYNGNDRSEPVDCGSGGIFRRQNARFVNADDQRWFAKTIIADGGTFCVWVNGLQVADWTDKRPPNRNPRKGRRLKAGTIILQGHDPTTDVSFRAMKIRNLESRR